ncbi:A24 family peptidase [Microvirgula aerodenitrificans]|uniref:A24 family peptidase n=1 Tax=Microvirgula aerodenitrificans TaxID=57480 RepID=UPI000685260A|nr:prepilin peptidase [Microvirgula aerodenitrificans]
MESFWTGAQHWASLGISSASSLILVGLAWHDLLYRRLPNQQVASLALLFPVQLLSAGWPPGQLIPHLAIALVTLLFCAILVAIGGFGGGDAKLAATVMLWAGPAAAGTTLLLITQAGLLLALTGLAAERMLPRLAPDSRLHRALSSLVPVPGVPYGIALSLGGLYAVWTSFSMHA